MQIGKRWCVAMSWLAIAVLTAEAATSAPAQRLAPPPSAPDYNLQWVDNTSGPFYTGTADVEPRGSFYIEPLYFNYRTRNGNNVSLPLKLAYGLGHRAEADLYLSSCIWRAPKSSRIPRM